jgi:hypothetical protein
MREDRRFLGAEIVISDREFLLTPYKEIQRIICRKLAETLAEEMVKHNLVPLKEYPDLINREKRIRAEIAILEPEEYKEFIKMKTQIKDFKDLLSKID